ncbi:hypothetical protein [Faecalibacter rhinopitheci]|uniref:Uncharacterized protein n=1 Tax=Faecalibacter rhinopitheci TaxID=2779678 RepID=A0A8J7FSA1_9FLAO|nr:hypothetical protein [Faecalibacter rhinopitheci]MBF0598005.1 hypothetical protein [Faecalibacter rhinopitheci]
MSYKKQQPKLADTLDVFIDRVESIEKAIIKIDQLNKEIDLKNKSFYTEIDDKINHLRKVKIQLDLANLNEESTRINNELKNVCNDSSNQIKSSIKAFDLSLSKLTKYRVDYVIYFLTCLIGITICSIFFAGNQYAEKIKEREQKEHYMNFIKSNEDVLKIYNKR